MIFWKFNVGDKLILNPEESKKNMEREYYVVDRYIEGVEEGIAAVRRNVRIMYVLFGASSHTFQAIAEYDIMDVLDKNNGEVKRNELEIAKWTKTSAAYEEALDEILGRKK